MAATAYQATKAATHCDRWLKVAANLKVDRSRGKLRMTNCEYRIRKSVLDIRHFHRFLAFWTAVARLDADFFACQQR
jgi:hypothetical protein